MIVSEPSNPWMAGVGDLFASEFYGRARSRLKPDGLMVQWFHAYEMDDALFAVMLRTFQETFPYVTIWNVVDSDVLLVGSRQPLAPDFPAMERAFMKPAVWRDLERAGILCLTTLLALQSASEDTARALAGPGPFNSELRPLLEYGAPKAFFRGVRVSALKAHDDRQTPGRQDELLLPRFLRARGRALERREFMDYSASPYPHEEPVLKDLAAQWLKRFPRDPRARALANAAR